MAASGLVPDKQVGDYLMLILHCFVLAASVKPSLAAASDELLFPLLFLSLSA